MCTATDAAWMQHGFSMAAIRHPYTVQLVFRKENLTLPSHLPSSQTLLSAKQHIFLQFF